MSLDIQIKNILIDNRYRLGIKLGAGNFGEIRIGILLL